MHDCLLTNGLQPMDWLDGQIFEKIMSGKLVRKELGGKVCGFASLTGKGCEDTVFHVNADQIVSSEEFYSHVDRMTLSACAQSLSLTFPVIFQ